MKGRRVRTVLKWTGGTVLLALLALSFAGVFSRRVPPGWAPPSPSPSPGGLRTVRARRARVPLYYEAPGVVRSRRVTEVASQTTGRILTVAVREGDRVRRGDPLVRIEGELLQARLEQAEQALAAARAAEAAAGDQVAAAAAARRRARREWERTRDLYAEKAATARALEAAEAAYRESQARLEAARARLQGARAEVARARSLVAEAQVALSYTQVVAPTDGQVVARLVDPGDLAWAGRPLVRLHDPHDLRLEADVREGLIRSVGPGAEVEVVIDALELRLRARVDEIVPSADPLSRTFRVKAALPRRRDLRPGLFGRLRLQVGTSERVLVPAAAVERLGQLERVRVRRDGRLRYLFVRTGARRGDDLEVLTGLKGGGGTGPPAVGGTLT